MNLNPIAATLSIRHATLEARRRTGDQCIGTAAQIGYYRVERVTFDERGFSFRKPLTDWTSAEKVIAFLNSL